MAQQRQHEQVGGPRLAPEVSGALTGSRIRVGILFAVLTVLAVDAFAAELWLRTRTGHDTCEQIAVQPDEGLMSSGRHGSPHTMGERLRFEERRLVTEPKRSLSLGKATPYHSITHFLAEVQERSSGRPVNLSFWDAIIIKLKVLLRLGVYVAAMTATWRTFAARDKAARTAEANLTNLRNESRASRLEMVAAKSEAESENDRMAATIRDMQEKHDVLRAKVGEETRKVDAAERGGAVTETVWRAAEDDLTALRTEAVAWRKKAMAARAEAFAAREEAAADKERMKIALANSDMRAGRKSGEAFAAVEVMGQKLALVRRKSAHEMKRAEAAEKATAVMNTAWRATEAALLASQEETASARAQVLAEKKRAARVLTTMRRKSSAAAAPAPEDKNAFGTEL